MAATRSRGLTLVELLVATALGVILISVVTFIWLQSNRIFTTTVNTLQAYQRLRTVLDAIERDVSNMHASVDMEPFIDADLDGHFDDGVEQLKTVGPGTGAPLGAAAPAFRAPYEARDPATALGSEFTDAALQSIPYLFGPFVASPAPYQITGEGYLEGRDFWRDELYFRTFLSTEDGVTKAGIVHYRLVPGSSGRSALRRRAWTTDGGGRIVAATPGVIPTDRTAILVDGVCDLKFGFFFRAAASGGEEGNWYHVGKGGLTGPEPTVYTRDRERGFRDAILSAEQIMLPSENLLNGHNAIMFFYRGFGRVELSDGYPPLFRTIKAINSPEASGSEMDEFTNFGFSGVRPGDQVYLLNATDDDNTQAGGVTSKAAPPGIFPDGALTVDEIFSDASKTYVSVKFKESINFFNLARYWLGPEYGGSPGSFVVDTTNQGATGGPPRTLRGSFNVEYRVGFLPPAFLVRLSVDDPQNRKVHSVERVIRILQH